MEQLRAMVFTRRRLSEERRLSSLVGSRRQSIVQGHWNLALLYAQSKYLEIWMFVNVPLQKCI